MINIPNIVITVVPLFYMASFTNVGSQSKGKSKAKANTNKLTANPKAKYPQTPSPIPIRTPIVSESSHSHSQSQFSRIVHDMTNINNRGTNNANGTNNRGINNANGTNNRGINSRGISTYTVHNIVDTEVIEYPFMDEIISNPIILFDNLIKTRLTRDGNSWTFNRRYTRTSNFLGPVPYYMKLVIDARDYYATDAITDCYVEKIRVQSRVNGHDAPIKSWYSDTLQRYLKDKKPDHNSFASNSEYLMAIKDLAYSSKLYYECTRYNPSVARDIILMFNAKHVLDLSAGWGDRLIGALATGAYTYHGCDPNDKLQDVYRNINNSLNGLYTNFDITSNSYYNIVTDVNIQCCTANEYVVQEGMQYDMALLCPPYYTKEIYTDAIFDMIKNQSVDEWLSTFMYPYLTKCWYALRPEGVMALMIEDYGNVRIVDRICDYMEHVLSAYPLGVVGIESRRVVPIWLWCKVNPADMYKVD